MTSFFEVIGFLYLPRRGSTLGRQVSKGVARRCLCAGIKGRSPAMPVCRYQRAKLGDACTLNDDACANTTPIAPP